MVVFTLLLSAPPYHNCSCCNNFSMVLKDFQLRQLFTDFWLKPEIDPENGGLKTYALEWYNFTIEFTNFLTLKSSLFQHSQKCFDFGCIIYAAVKSVFPRNEFLGLKQIFVYQSIKSVPPPPPPATLEKIFKIWQNLATLLIFCLMPCP